MAGSHQHVRVNQHAQHAEPLVPLDEAHATHVRRQIINPVAAVYRLDAGRLLFQIQHQIFRFGKPLIPLPQRLFVRRADFVPLLKQGLDEVASDKSAGPGDEDEWFVH